jgi:hypothetical protein
VLFARWSEVRSGSALNAARGAQLADVDWRVHAVVAAERLAHLRSARLVLDLHVHEPASADQLPAAPAAPLRLELTKGDLDRLLAHLAACNTVRALISAPFRLLLFLTPFCSMYSASSPDLVSVCVVFLYNISICFVRGRANPLLLSQNTRAGRLQQNPLRAPPASNNRDHNMLEGGSARRHETLPVPVVKSDLVLL